MCVLLYRRLYVFTCSYVYIYVCVVECVCAWNGAPVRAYGVEVPNSVAIARVKCQPSQPPQHLCAGPSALLRFPVSLGAVLLCWLLRSFWRRRRAQQEALSRATARWQRAGRLVRRRLRRQLLWAHLGRDLQRTQLGDHLVRRGGRMTYRAGGRRPAAWPRLAQRHIWLFSSSYRGDDLECSTCCRRRMTILYISRYFEE